MADLNAHEAGNGGQSQRRPKARSSLLYSATIIAGADLTVTQGRPLTMERDERTSSIGLAGVMAMACKQRRPDATREAPAVIAVRINR
jgi:hypothetical protein